MKVPEIDLDQAKELLDKGAGTFVDIRMPDAFEAGHVAGAMHLTDETLPEFLEKADKARPVVVYCYRGIASRNATAFLLQNGFGEVYSMRGGFDGWSQLYEYESGAGTGD